MSLSPSSGSSEVKPSSCRISRLVSRRARLVPTRIWSNPLATSSSSRTPRESTLLVPCCPRGRSSPCRTAVAKASTGESAACLWTSVRRKSGSAWVKNPVSATGGSWAGSPSTRILTPKARRSSAIGLPTIDTSSITSRSASFRSLSGLGAKLGWLALAFSCWISASRLDSLSSKDGSSGNCLRSSWTSTSSSISSSRTLVDFGAGM